MSGRETLEQASGLLDDFTLTVEEAWFGTDDMAEFNPDRIYLFLRGPAEVDGEVVEEEYRERYSIGNGWEVVEEGRAIEHGSGKNKPRRGSGHGWLVAHVVSAFEEDKDTLYDRVDEFGTNEAGFWEGLVLTMERKVVSRFRNNDGEMQDYELPVPTAVEVAGGKSKAKAKGKSKAKSSGKAKGDDPEQKLRKKLAKLAAKFDEDEHDEFVDTALEDFGDALEEYDELHAEVLDEDGELWTEAH